VIGSIEMDRLKIERNWRLRRSWGAAYFLYDVDDYCTYRGYVYSPCRGTSSCQAHTGFSPSLDRRPRHWFQKEAP
jgi:hypothetical protein